MHCGGQGWRHVRLRKRRLFFGSLDEDLQEGEGEELHIDQSSRKGCQSTLHDPERWRGCGNDDADYEKPFAAEKVSPSYVE